MNPRLRGAVRAAILVLVLVLLLALFPRAMAMAEMAARELRYLWWLVLLAALGAWLIWGCRRKP